MRWLIQNFCLIILPVIWMGRIAFASPEESFNRSSIQIGSRHVYKHLSPQQCNKLVMQSVQLNLEKVADNKGLIEVLNVLGAECGLNSDPENISSQPHLWVVAGTSFAALNDGAKISFGESALAAKEFGLTPPNTSVRIITLEESRKVAGEPEPKSGLIARIAQRMDEIIREGKPVIYFSGYAWHDRNTYTNIANLNEKAWGVGYGRERINSNGNYESLSAVVFTDSHSDPEFNLAYLWQKLFRMSPDISVGAGFTAGLTSRSDILHYVPVPYAFPTFSLNLGRFSLYSVLIPKLNGGLNNGNVIFLFTKVPLDFVKLR